MPFEVTILGSSSATPTVDRHPSAQILNIRGSLMLIDCGEATQNQLLHYRISHARITTIFISHLHGDHYLGLNGLLATINFQGRSEPLAIYAPAPLERMIYDHFEYSGTQMKFPLNFYPTRHGQDELLMETDQFTVTSLSLEHRIPTTGFLFREKVGPRHINAEACERIKVPFAHYQDLKEGKDYTDENGLVHINDTLTFPPSATRSYAYVSDSRFLPRLAGVLDGVNLLYHESTFLDELRDRAHETFHSTALQAAQMAKMANVGKLIIGHYSSRYSDLTPLLDEAQSLFENSHLAIEGTKFSVD